MKMGGGGCGKEVGRADSESKKWWCVYKFKGHGSRKKWNHLIHIYLAVFTELLM